MGEVNDGKLPTSMLTPDQLDLKADDADSYLPHHQSIRRMSTSWSCPLWKVTIKLLPIFPELGHMILRAWAGFALCAWQSNKAILFCFTQNSVSEDLISHLCTEKLSFPQQTKVPMPHSCCCPVAKSLSDSATPWTAARQASLSFTISQSLRKLMSIESMMPSNHLILCHSLLLLLSVFLCIRSLQ